MSSSNVFKACVSILAISAFTACATGPASGNDPKAANQQAQFPKPTPEVIAKINNAPPLEQASFWVKHYNLHPTDLDISLAYFNALMGLNSIDEAAEVAKFATVSFPDNPDVFMAYGKALAKQDKALEAVRAYGRVVDLSPYDAAPLAAMGAIFDSREDHETAQLAYHRALALDPDRPITLSNLGMSLTLVGKLEQAEEALGRAVELPGATPAIRQNYALILGLLGEFDKAREISAIDAPDGVADRNTDFLKAMIGDNPRIEAIAKAAKNAPKSSVRQIVKETEAPKAAPTEPIVSAALNSKPDQAQASTDAAETETTPPVTQIASTASDPKPKRQLRKRTRNRSLAAPSGGE